MIGEDGLCTLAHMLATQKEYDHLVMGAHGIKGYDEIELANIRNALLDEIGELNHETKAEWCWWKSTQEPEDSEKVLEEFADVVHFCLMMMLKMKQNEPYALGALCELVYSEDTLMPIDMAQELYKCSGPLKIILGGKNWLNLGWDELFAIYAKKNDINRQRVKEGY